MTFFFLHIGLGVASVSESYRDIEPLPRLDRLFELIIMTATFRLSYGPALPASSFELNLSVCPDTPTLLPLHVTDQFLFWGAS
jgi:hypothetical protein